MDISAVRSSISIPMFAHFDTETCGALVTNAYKNKSRTMRFKDKPDVDPAAYRRKLKVSLIVCSAIFLITAVFCVMEVYALLALQFCDGENLMSLFWATWTMLQLGSEMAILGIVLALWHSIVEIRHP